MEIDFPVTELEITVNTPTGTKTINVAEELEINQTNLNESFIEQPGKYAWWGMLAEQARYRMDQLKAEMEKEEAEADRRIRASLEANKEKVTESIVTRRIKLDPFYLEKQKRYLEAKKTYSTLDRILKAFDHRLDSMISIGANKRKEFD